MKVTYTINTVPASLEVEDVYDLKEQVERVAQALTTQASEVELRVRPDLASCVAVAIVRDFHISQEMNIGEITAGPANPPDVLEKTDEDANAKKE